MTSDQGHEKSISSKPDVTPQLRALDFLLGSWQAISGPEEATGGFIFASQLQSHVIVRTNHADYPATSNQLAYHHEDLMIIYHDETLGLRADYYDSEGHIIRYAGKAIAPNEVVFTSEPTALGPGFRLTY